MNTQEISMIEHLSELARQKLLGALRHCLIMLVGLLGLEYSGMLWPSMTAYVCLPVNAFSLVLSAWNVERKLRDWRRLRYAIRHLRIVESGVRSVTAAEHHIGQASAAMREAGLYD